MLNAKFDLSCLLMLNYVNRDIKFPFILLISITIMINFELFVCREWFYLWTNKKGLLELDLSPRQTVLIQ